MGNSSLQMCCEMYNNQGILVVEANCTIVMFDFEKKISCPIPEFVRKYITDIEQIF